jgi:hypothetical protein
VSAVIVGGVLVTRLTVTAKTHDAERLALSRAAQVTLVAPSGNAEPDAGVQLTNVGAVPPTADGVA